MSKSSKPKKQEPNIKAKINIDGNVSNSNIIIGHGNTILNEAVKTEYALFTIPQPVIDFTGREAELAGLKASFTSGAIITGLSGAGGIGKTELARKLAHEIAGNFPDAQMNIDLLGTAEKPTSPEDAMRRLLEPFYVGQKLPDDETQLIGLYHQTFGKKKVLLLLDNAANAAQVRPLIPPVPSAAIITSRQHFSLTEFGLHEPVSLDVFSPEKARDLLRSASPKLNSSPDEEVNKLAKLCGHLPLALRVAASLLNERPDWKTSHLIKRLSDERTRLQRLRREDDANLDVDAMLNLSYELLSNDLKKHFRVLGIFAAPFAKVSAKVVLGIEHDDELDDVLGKLIGRSLLKHQESQKIVEDLYAMHDLARLFATKKLLETNEYEEALTRHAEHFLEWASVADNLYQKGNENTLVGLTHFRFIFIHLYSTYERLLPEKKILSRPQTADRWLSIFPARCPYVLNLHVPPREMIFILQTALEAACRLNDKKNESGYLGNLGIVHFELGETRKAIEFYEQALVIAREIGDRSSEGVNFGNLGTAYLVLGDTRRSMEFYEQALVVARDFGDRRNEGNWLGDLGLAYADLGEGRKAIKFYKQALVITREIGDRRGEGNVLGNLGTIHFTLGETRKAIKFQEQALVITREIGDRRGEGEVLGNLGTIHFTLGETRKAIKFYKQALVITREIGDRRGEGEVLGNLGFDYFNLGKAHKAIELYEQALVIDREIGDRRREAKILRKLGNAYRNLDEIHKAIEFYVQALVIHREIGDRSGEGTALGNVGLAYAALGDARKAIEFHEQALVIAREIGDRSSEGTALVNVGIAYKNLGDARKAIEFHEQALVIAREIGDRSSERIALGNLGIAYAALGDARKAIEFYEQALVIAREIGDRSSEGIALGNLGVAYKNLGDARKAIEFHEQALVIAREIGDRSSEGIALGNLGVAYKNLGESGKSKKLWLEALVIFRAIESPHVAMVEKRLVELDKES